MEILVSENYIIIENEKYIEIDILKPIIISNENVKIYIKPGYFISEDGKLYNVYSKSFVKPYFNGEYYTVNIKTTLGSNNIFLHRLILLAYDYPLDLSLSVNHKDGNKTNNNLSNLEWVTIIENSKHARYNGLSITGENCSWSKLSEFQVREICDKVSKHQYTTITSLAKEYEVNTNVIRDILVGNTWKDISIQYNIKYDKRAYFTILEVYFICYMMEIHYDKGFEYIYYLIIYFMGKENSHKMRERIWKIWNKESFTKISSQFKF